MKRRRWNWALLLSLTIATVGCGLTGGHNLPPAARLAEPGPGVGGPGPGVLPPAMPPFADAETIGTMAAAPMMPGGAELMGAGYAAGGLHSACGLHHAMAGPAGGAGGSGMEELAAAGCAPDSSGTQQVQVLFTKPESMQINWDVSSVGQFDSPPLVTPGRQSFQQGSIYRLKLTNIPGTGREGVELYPTLEIGPPAYRSLAYLAHNAIPVQITEEDFDQVLAGNFVTKVIYLPDPEFQGLAVADVATLVSTRLDPGLDPIEEASRKGVILAVIRIGNKDLETPGAGEGTSTDVQVMPAGYCAPVGASAAAAASADPTNTCHPFGVAVPSTPGYQNPAVRQLPPGGMPPDLIAGLNVPQYGMTMSGTPIGLPGPPHIPLGVPAGLQKHVMRNWTSMHLPKPVEKLKINVKQRPGLSYPHPASKAWIKEDTIHPSVHYGYHGFGAPSTGQIQFNTGHPAHQPAMMPAGYPAGYGAAATGVECRDAGGY